MLAQEVRDMGSHKEIIFMDGIRPILARKIRYYEVPWLAARVLPPPEVPAIEPIVCSTRREASATDTAAAPAASETRRSHPATAEDIERIDELTLDDFDIDLSRVQFPDVPPGQRASERDLKAAAESLLAAMKGEHPARGGEH
jgi:type IV secretion system protein VirD4